jgi:hypothetical protein
MANGNRSPAETGSRTLTCSTVASICTTLYRVRGNMAFGALCKFAPRGPRWDLLEALRWWWIFCKLSLQSSGLTTTNFGKLIWKVWASPACKFLDASPSKIHSGRQISSRREVGPTTLFAPSGVESQKLSSASSLIANTACVFGRNLLLP